MILIAAFNSFAAPYNGDEFEYTQPDGSTVTVLLFGDELHIDAESLDGYTVIVGEDGYVYYAKLSEDDSEYVSTGVRYTKNNIVPVVQKGMRISQYQVQEKRKRNRKALGTPEDGELYYNGSNNRARIDASIAQPAALSDATHMKGVTLVIEFPAMNGANAINATASREHVDSVFNHPKFRGGQGSSVYDWYNDVSNGKLQYKNTVVPFVTVDREKAYYDDNCSEGYKMVPQLVHSALQKLKTEVEAGRASLEQPSTTRRSNSEPNTVMALNIYVAGRSSCEWAKGVWPHQGSYRGVSNQKITITENGITYNFYWYQMSAMGTTNDIVSSVNTVVHENGHMIMNWPDLYNYDSNNGNVNVVRNYCVMSTGTAMPNPHFRNLAGWIDVIDITDMNATLSHTANSHTVYKYTRNAKESYFIEARIRTGRSSPIPGEGLIIWQVHTDGQNSTVKAENPWPLVKVIQANNINSTQKPFVELASSTAANVPFRSGGGSRNTNFSNISEPAALYYDGTPSDINIFDVSEVGDVMTFKIGTGYSAPSSSSVVPSSSSSLILSSSSSEIETFALRPQIIEGNIRAYAKGNAIVLENLPQETRAEVYDLRGKLVYYTHSRVIPMQAKGMYIINISGKILRVVVR
ncbi:MAG: M6 family metalloprotease domain-containing protein [Fibromonadales bacterium]|nr:M6 family metalloprotease domain-containing protein [Fibromonadales bacterium]